MALSVESFNKAKSILEEIAGHPLPGMEVSSESEEWKEGFLLFEGKQSCGGWESVWVNIKTPNAQQVDIFYRRKHEVPNSHMLSVKDDLLCLGWF